jgi:hypothetical protein
MVVNLLSCRAGLPAAAGMWDVSGAGPGIPGTHPAVLSIIIPDTSSPRRYHGLGECGGARAPVEAGD